MEGLHEEVYDLLSVNKSTWVYTMYTECTVQDLMDVIIAVSDKVTFSYKFESERLFFMFSS